MLSHSLSLYIYIYICKSPFCIYIYIYIEREREGICGMLVIIIGNGHGDLSSNLGQGYLHFSYH